MERNAVECGMCQYQGKDPLFYIAVEDGDIGRSRFLKSFYDTKVFFNVGNRERLLFLFLFYFLAPRFA